MPNPPEPTKCFFDDQPKKHQNLDAILRAERLLTRISNQSSRSSVARNRVRHGYGCDKTLSPQQSKLAPQTPRQAPARVPPPAFPWSAGQRAPPPAKPAARYATNLPARPSPCPATSDDLLKLIGKAFIHSRYECRCWFTLGP
jgi:hypothetical protein